MKSLFAINQSVTVVNLKSEDHRNFGRIQYIDQAGRYWVRLYGVHLAKPFEEKELVLTRDVGREE